LPKYVQQNKEKFADLLLNSEKMDKIRSTKWKKGILNLRHSIRTRFLRKVKKLYISKLHPEE